MTTLRKSRTAIVLLAVLAGAALLSGCQGGNGDAADRKPQPSATPHGYIEGAEEAAEQQSRLVIADAGTGSIRTLDLITGDVKPLKPATGVKAIRTDGRFAYLSTGNGTRVVDSGAWMVDHGDHVHYYRAAIRDVGTIPGASPRAIHSDPAVTAVTSSSGAARLLDRKVSEGGAVGDSRSLPDAGSGAVVPYKEHLLVAGAGAANTSVEVRDRKGARVSSLSEQCPQPHGEAVTRRGVVFGCSDGALLVSEKKETFTAEKIPYNSDVDAGYRALEFRHRPGSTTLVSPSGRDAVWVLDVTKRSWKRINTGPVISANTAGEGSPLLALGKDGVLAAYDISTGKRTADKRVLTTPLDSSSIQVDTSRAYINDAASRKVYEVDYNDQLRMARTFKLDLSPTHMVETGR
ncbi:hypothetical protein [Streptomyces sp. PTY087I2]|uniref:hypothetical protein n=1 Tax=Streptomyces sp. PTY087I2 TaxID=1819298 RepID=UPI00080B061E|nr:hypothetical protein [Streptomyces sp. PTY087I2]OCC14016.1 hypothetical protein A3Q37_00289 [Streptomyces sp. PTY087I2]